MKEDYRRKYLRDCLLSSQPIKNKLKERSQSFLQGKNQHQSLNEAWVPRPDYTPDGTSQYHKADVNNARKEALYNIQDQQRIHNKELSETVERELSNPDFSEERKDAKEYDIQEILDESIEEYNQTSQDKLYSNREINQYLHQHGIDPERSRKGVKPLDNEIDNDQEKDILKDFDEPEKVKDIEQSKIQSWENNRKDLDIDYDPEI